jgi:hypothetical protein
MIVVLSLALMCEPLFGCGKIGRAPVRYTASTKRPAPHTAGQRSRLGVGAESEQYGVFAANCSRGATRCELTFGNGEHFSCTGHPDVVVEEGPPTYVEHSTCKQVHKAGWLTAGHRPVPSCSAATIGISPGPLRESEMTQEGSNSFILANTSRTSCVLYGYPRVTLYHDGRTLPLRDRNGGSYVSARRPRPLLLGPGVQAYFKAAKTVCQEGRGARPTQIRVRLPGGGTVGMAMSSEDRLDYCAGSGPDRRIGDSLFLSPIVAAPYEAGPDATDP